MFHWQNLNEDGRGRPKGWPHHGRCWWHLGQKKPILKFSWNLWANFCGVDLSRDEEGWSLMLAFPPVALWFGFEKWDGKRSDRCVSVTVHDWALWWRMWAPKDSWSSKTPKWRDGSWHPGRTFFGPWIYETRIIERRDIVVPMPEGEYRGHAELRHAVRGHKWSPFKHRNPEVEIQLRQSIPFSGKGENSWDCGEDGTRGMTGPARTIEEAIGNLVASTLETRRRRGDPAKWPTAPAEAA